VPAFAVLVAVVAALLQAQPASPALRCPVTLPNYSPANRSKDSAAGFSAAAFNHGNANMRVHLTWFDGILRASLLTGGGARASVNSDGSISTKLGWWRGTPGTFSITGRRLDRSAPPLRVSLSRASYPTIGFIPSGLTFPTTGCWRISARQGVGRLSFVVMVRRL
jgi:hypothetical protein